jgi:tetratricopeptide (TPR) repeat protein
VHLHTTKFRRSWGVRQIAAAFLISWCSTAGAEPYRPSDDSTVLERLVAKPGDPAQREIRALRQQVQANPGAPERALALAQRYFDLALERGDPRHAGQAEATLAPWRSSRDAEILLLRAQLAQYRHGFEESLGLFAQALEADPSNTRALSWRAAVNMVMARYEAVRPDCQRLRPLGEDLLAAGCEAYLDATLGRAEPAYQSLQAALTAAPDARTSLRQWSLTVLAEIARRLGRSGEADRHYRDALAVGPQDVYLLVSYAEFLLLERRWDDVVALLSSQQASDSLLLLLARAERERGNPKADEHAKVLRARFADAGLRGDTLNAQDEAWFQLVFERDARRALSLAAANWAIQKEPRDAEIVLAAAAAAGDAQAAAPVLAWMRLTGIQDPRLAALAASLAAAPRSPR